jgi:uncharacterized membrane protein YeaQ/YmgE (transglycosylase-associated protein family)
VINILLWLLLGLVAGWLASTIMGRGGYGIVGDIVVGLVGALLGGWLGGVLFNRDFINGPLSIETLVVAVLGAIILIAILRAVTGGRTRV